MKPDILICMDGGCVTEVYTEKHMTWRVLDADVEGALSEELVAHPDGSTAWLSSENNTTVNMRPIYSNLAVLAKPYLSLVLALLPTTLDKESALQKLCNKPGFLEEFISAAVRPVLRGSNVQAQNLAGLINEALKEATHG